LRALNEKIEQIVGSIFLVWVLSLEAYLFAAEFREPEAMV
jgi:hypothetical protein